MILIIDCRMLATQVFKHQKKSIPKCPNGHNGDSSDLPSGRWDPGDHSLLNKGPEWIQPLGSVLTMSFYQCPFQEPIDWRYLPYIRPIFQAYVREYSPKIWPYMVQYLHFRILKFPLILPWGCFFFFPCWLLTNPSYWSEIWPKVFSNCCVWPDSVTHQNGLCISSSWNHQSHLEVDVMLAPGNPWHDVSIYLYTPSQSVSSIYNHDLKIPSDTVGW